MQISDGEQKNCLKILKEFICKLKNAKGDVKGVKRISSGNLHKTGGQRNPNKMWNCIFCESTRIWGRTTLVFGTVEIRISLRIRQKILRPISLSFRNIFVSLISSHQKMLKIQREVQKQLMDFRPAQDVDRLILGKITFVLSVLL